jgi:hypothetical protein
MLVFIGMTSAFLAESDQTQGQQSVLKNAKKQSKYTLHGTVSP